MYEKKSETLHTLPLSDSLVQAVASQGARAQRVASSPDLSVTISGNPDLVGAGQNITYTILVKNNDALAASGFTLTATAVPEHTTFVAFTAFASGTSTTPPVDDTGDIVSTNSSLGAGASAQFTLVVHVVAQTAEATSIMSAASVTGSAFDPDLANNVAGTTTKVQIKSADLEVSMIVDISPQANNASQPWRLHELRGGSG